MYSLEASRLDCPGRGPDGARVRHLPRRREERPFRFTRGWRGGDREDAADRRENSPLPAEQAAELRRSRDTPAPGARDGDAARGTEAGDRRAEPGETWLERGPLRPHDSPGLSCLSPFPRGAAGAGALRDRARRYPGLPLGEENEKDSAAPRHPRAGGGLQAGPRVQGRAVPGDGEHPSGVGRSGLQALPHLHPPRGRAPLRWPRRGRSRSSGPSRRSWPVCVRLPRPSSPGLAAAGGNALEVAFGMAIATRVLRPRFSVSMPSARNGRTSAAGPSRPCTWASAPTDRPDYPYLSVSGEPGRPSSSREEPGPPPTRLL